MTIDRLEGIRQRTEAGGSIRRIDMKYLLSEVDRMNALHKREIIVTGEYAQRVIDLTARAEQAERERDALLTDFSTIERDGLCEVCSFGDSSQISKEDCMKDCCFNYRTWRGLPQAGEESR